MTSVANESTSSGTIAVSAIAPSHDNRGSWIPNGAMIKTKIMELRKRRGLMAALIVVNIGVPTIFLLVRPIAHAVPIVDERPILPAPGLANLGYGIIRAIAAGHRGAARRLS